jgi:pimeloyl-ACP methyl ester carboxylesterase
MTRFVLVPGACHGGWWFEPVAAQLRTRGHRAEAVTLAGLDPDADALATSTAINLDVHVEQVRSVVDADPEPVVLVGHSYAGSVITAVADHRPAAVRALLYLDAFVPEDGDSCWSMTNDEQRQWYTDGSASTGLGVEPLPFFDPRTRPHPIGTLLQRSRLTGRYREVASKHYVLAAAAEWLPHSPFPAVAARLRDRPDWSVTEVDVRHNMLVGGPHLLTQLALDLA